MPGRCSPDRRCVSPRADRRDRHPGVRPGPGRRPRRRWSSRFRAARRRRAEQARLVVVQDGGCEEMHGAFEQRGQLPQAGFVAFAVDAGEASSSARLRPCSPSVRSSSARRCSALQPRRQPMPAISRLGMGRGMRAPEEMEGEALWTRDRQGSRVAGGQRRRRPGCAGTARQRPGRGRPRTAHC